MERNVERMDEDRVYTSRKKIKSETNASDSSSSSASTAQTGQQAYRKESNDDDEIIRRSRQFPPSFSTHASHHQNNKDFVYF